MQSEQINDLAAALSKAQGEMPTAKFNSTNKFLGNKYADLGAVIEASRPVLVKHGLSVSQLVIGNGEFIGVETILLHSSGQWISSVVTLPAGDEKGKSMAQVAGSIVSYLRRYALSAILGIYADEDSDGNQGQRKQEQKPSAKIEIEYPAELAVVTNSKGTPYVELDSEALGKMQIGIRKALSDTGMSDDDKATYAMKNDAINQILALRNGK
jgi:hypothetical protein